MKKIIYNFKDGVAFPKKDGKAYKIVKGTKSRIFRFETSDKFVVDGLVLSKICKVHTYRYPFISFERSSYELITFDDTVSKAS